MATLDDIQAWLKQMGLTGTEPDLQNKVAQVPPNLAPTAPPNNTPSSYDVGVSDNTVTQNGGMPRTPAPTPSATLPPLVEEPSAPAPVIPPVSAPAASQPTPTVPPVAPTSAVPSPKASDAMAALTSNVSNDNEARKANEEALSKHEHGAGLIAPALGGIADAFGMAAKPFGGTGTQGLGQKLEEQNRAETDKETAKFETKTKNDPNSDISKSYRQMVLQIAPDLAKQPNFQNMSAQAIGDKLPLIDTMMKAQAAKDTKEIGLEQVKANKALSMSTQQGNERDRMWNQGVQSINQIRGDKPLVDSEVMRNGAISAYQAIDNIQKQGRAPNQYEYIDLLGQLWKARTGGVLTSEELRHMDPKTIQSQLGPIATYLSGDPKAITTPAATNAIKNFVIQSGKTADQIHENYMQTRGIGAAAGRMKELYPEDADRLAKMGRGLSFADAMKQAGAQTPQSGTTPSGGSDIEAKKTALRQKLGL